MKSIWIGFFFFVALIVLAFATLIVGQIKILKEPFRITALFDEIHGLKVGDDVTVEGVEYGRVSNIKLEEKGVIVTLELDEKVPFYEDYSIRITSYALVGGSYVIIRRGTPTKSLIKITKDTYLIGKTAKGSIEAFANLVEENRPNINETLSNLREITDSIKKAEGTLGQLIKDPKLYNELLTSIKDIQSFINDMKSAKGVIPTLIYDENVNKDVQGTIRDLKQSAESLKNILKNVEKGEGTIGKLLKEDELYEKAKEAIKGVDQTLGKAGRARLYLETNYQVFNESMDIARVNISYWPTDDKYFQFGAAFLILDPEGEVDYEKKSQNKDQTKIVPEVLLAYKIPWVFDKHLTLRAGMLEGKAGGALDFEWNLFKHPVRLSYEMRDDYDDVDDEDVDERLDGALHRVYLKTPLWSGTKEWWEKVLNSFKVVVGANRLFDDEEYFIGLGIEYEEEDLRTLVGLVGASR